MRRRAIFVPPLLLAGVLAIAVGATQFLRGADAAGAVLYHPSSDCSSVDGSVTFEWAPPPGGASQWLDVSLFDNGFEADTFTRVSLKDGQSSHTMEALARGVPTYWRIVSVDSSGEVTSETKRFVACGGPFLLWGPLECRNYTSAAVRFQWAPSANYEGEQYIEFDTSGDWSGDDFWRAGPFSPSAETARRSGFVNDVTYLFRVVLEVNGEQRVSSTGRFTPDCLPEINSANYGSDERLIVPAIGVDAPMNIRDVNYDGLLGVPNGGYDVIRYNFAFFPHLQGQVGGPGPTLIAGHYDYHVIGPAVFWDLAALKAGDVIEHWDGDVKYTYVVDWVTAVPFSEPLNQYIQDSRDDSLLLVTCFGEFDRDQFGGYNQRTLVHATRM